MAAVAWRYNEGEKRGALNKGVTGAPAGCEAVTFLAFRILKRPAINILEECETTLYGPGTWSVSFKLLGLL